MLEPQQKSWKSRIEQGSPIIFFPLIMILLFGAVAITNYFHGKRDAFNNKHLDMCLQKLENEQNTELLNIKQKMCFERWGECKR